MFTQGTTPRFFTDSSGAGTAVRGGEEACAAAAKAPSRRKADACARDDSPAAVAPLVEERADVVNEGDGPPRRVVLESSVASMGCGDGTGPPETAALAAGVGAAALGAEDGLIFSGCLVGGLRWKYGGAEGWSWAVTRRRGSPSCERVFGWGLQGLAGNH